MFAQVTLAVSNGPGNLKASCQQAPPTIDCGLLEKVCGFCTSVVGPPPHSKASGVILSANKIIELGVFVFSYLQLESEGTHMTTVVAIEASIGQKEHRETVPEGGMDHVLLYLPLPF